MIRPIKGKLQAFIFEICSYTPLKKKTDGSSLVLYVADLIRNVFHMSLFTDCSSIFLSQLWT